MPDGHPSLLRLMHLVSPSLPTGAFAYSQGLEWAIDAGWVHDGPDLQLWLADLIRHSITYVDIPLLCRMYVACRDRRETELAGWCKHLLALRESHELRMEERNRGRAMVKLLEGLHVPFSAGEKTIIANCQLAGFAMAAAHWDIPLSVTASGYVWSWLENQVIAGIKIIPLGQTEGHRILIKLDYTIMEAVEQGMRIKDNDIGASSPALAIACSLHETQYTRLYRS
jgi:urease accessory protein